MSYPGKPTFRKQIVGKKYLRQLRLAAGMSMSDVARELGVSKAAAYRQETGHTSVSKADVEKYLRMYNVTDETLAQRIIDLVHTSRKRGWWEDFRGTADLGQVEIADLEDLASSISNYEPMVIPGLAQTSEYSTAVIMDSNSQFVPHEVVPEKSLELRNLRKKILYKNPRPDVNLIFSEIALRFPFADKKVMGDQLAHLVYLIRSKGINIQLLLHRPEEGILLPTRPIFLVTTDSDDPESVVYFGHPFGGNTINDTDATNRISKLFSSLQDQALTAEDTARYLEGCKLYAKNGKGE